MYSLFYYPRFLAALPLGRHLATRRHFRPQRRTIIIRRNSMYISSGIVTPSLIDINQYIAGSPTEIDALPSLDDDLKVLFTLKSDTSVVPRTDPMMRLKEFPTVFERNIIKKMCMLLRSSPSKANRYTGRYATELKNRYQDYTKTELVNMWTIAKSYYIQPSNLVQNQKFCAALKAELGIDI